MSNYNLFVTICVQTFNHEKYIKECLDSLLKQETEYDYEILIGEDESNDKTREICIAYAENHPDKIRLNLNRRDEVIYINGNPSGRANMLKNFESSRGKYIALCEGDDYWIDPLKLQKQVSFLEQNRDYSATTSNTYYLRDGETKYTYIESKELWLGKKMGSEVKFEDIPNRLFPHTTTWMFRKERLEFFEEFKKFPVGDMPLFMILAHLGRINYSSEIQTVYRVHNEGALSVLRKIDPFKNLLDYAEMYYLVNKHCGSLYDKEIRTAIINDHFRLVKDNPTFKNARGANNQLSKLSELYDFTYNASIFQYVFIVVKLNLIKRIKNLKKMAWKLRKRK
ncbi:MAG: glycosyltransferase [Flavobacteriales bacterium]|nr:glycosyltransferase [Flavobacteriales bacterium]